VPPTSSQLKFKGSSSKLTSSGLPRYFYASAIASTDGSKGIRTYANTYYCPLLWSYNCAYTLDDQESYAALMYSVYSWRWLSDREAFFGACLMNAYVSSSVTRPSQFWL